MGPSPADSDRNDLGKVRVLTADMLAAMPWEGLRDIEGATHKVLWQAGAVAAIPGVWLMLYGVGVIAGGAFSVPAIPVMGACFLVEGALVALLLPGAVSPVWADLWLGAGFGGLHIAFDAVVARRYGG